MQRPICGFRNSSGLNEGYLEAHFLVGLNYFYLKNYDKSVEEFQRLSGIVPLGQVVSNLGIALSLQGLKSECCCRATAGS